MELQVDIGFEQLVKLIQRMPEQEWQKLKQVIDEKQVKKSRREEFRRKLLNGPVFSEQQLKHLTDTRKEIDQWRKD